MAGGPAPVELSADCTTCGLEAGVVELYDSLVAACRFGVPATARCKLCGARHEGAFSREPARPMLEVPANRCPACLDELGPRAIDDRRCAKCGATAKLTLVTPATPLDTAPALAAALQAWASRDAFSSREALAEAVFCDPDLASLLLRIQRNEPLEVVADPFANMGIRTTGGRDKGESRASKPPSERDSKATHAVKVAPDRVTVTPDSQPLKITTPSQDFRANVTVPDPQAMFVNAATDPLAPPIRVPAPPASVAIDPNPTMSSAGSAGTSPLEAPVVAPSVPPPISAPPRAIVFPLVSVIAADGEIHPAERALIDRFLESEGLAPLTEDEFRVHHPSEVAHLVPKERREMVVQLMCETATRRRHARRERAPRDSRVRRRVGRARREGRVLDVGLREHEHVTGASAVDEAAALRPLCALERRRTGRPMTDRKHDDHSIGAGGDTAGTVPEWASMFVPEEWAWFVATLAADLERRGMKHRFDMDAGCVHVEVSGPVPNVLGLQNIAQVCRTRTRDAWANAVAHHFDVAFDAKDGKAAEELAKDWGRARPYVKLRLYREDHLPSVPLVTWQIADGLVAVLTFDLPDTVISVRRPDRDAWPVSDEDLYSIALENIRKEGQLQSNEVDVGDRTTIHVLEGGTTFFAASHALFLDDYLGDRGNRARRGDRDPAASRRALPPDRGSARGRRHPEHARHRGEHVRRRARVDQPRPLLASARRR